MVLSVSWKNFLALSQEEKPGTHLTEREIARESHRRLTNDGKPNHKEWSAFSLFQETRGGRVDRGKQA